MSITTIERVSGSLRAPGRLLAAALALTTALAPGLCGQSTQDLRLTIGKSVVIDYPADVARISTSNPDVVDYAAVSTREILVHGKNHGTATLVVWSRTGQREFYNITVEHNLEPIRKILKASFPNEDIQVQAARDTVSLLGRATTPQVSERAAALVAPLAKTVINNLRVDAPQVDKQILLRVRFAELNRNLAQSYGVNLFSTGTAGTISRTSTGGVPAPSPSSIQGRIPGAPAPPVNFTMGDVLNIFAFRPDINLGVSIRALQGQGVLQILAEPNLVTTNGKEASFLVGGEFPVPVLQGGANAGAVTVQFREFGIRLTFNPVVTEHKTIKMHVRPEVSTIDLSKAVIISGFTIPALSTRRMETDVELAQGQSFAIGGLIDDRVSDSMSKVPGLANIPLLGTLFKSRSEDKTKTELIVLVTPEIIDPLNPGPVPAPPVFPKPTLDSQKFDKSVRPKTSSAAPVPNPPAVVTAGAGKKGKKS